MNENFFIGRRTVRAYESRHISDDLLEKLVEEASHAPTTGNMQLQCGCHAVGRNEETSCSVSLQPAECGGLRCGADILCGFQPFYKVV